MAHLTPTKRSQLEVLMKLGKKQTEIAELLEVAQSTVSRELRRIKNPYESFYAQMDAETKRHKAYEKRIFWWKRDPDLLKHVIKHLRKRWSPEHIVGDLRRQRKPSVSAKTIYEYVWKHPALHRYLRYKGKSPWRGGPVGDRTCIANRRDISERPKCVDTRRRYGDWESDLIIGKEHKGAIATFVERKSRYTCAVLLRNQSSREFLRAARRVFRSFPLQLRRTMTHDNGSEIALHERITRSVQIMVYCARPYHAWERGLCEQTNGLIRDYFPKGTDFRTLTQQRLDTVIESINTRPRHCLQFRSPKMVFEKVRKRYAFHGSE